MIKNRVFNVGDVVRLLCIPEDVLEIIPMDELEEVKTCVGKISKIESIENEFFWVGFGVMTEDNEQAYCSGHSFAVIADCLELVHSVG